MMPLSECEFQIDQHTGDDVPYVSRRVCEVFRGGLKRTTEFSTCQARLVRRGLLFIVLFREKVKV